MQTATKFAAVDNSGVIFGVGLSPEQAVSDARDNWDRYDLPNFLVRVLPCSELAFERLNENGYSRSDFVVDRIVCLRSEE